MMMSEQDMKKKMSKKDKKKNIAKSGGSFGSFIKKGNKK